MVGAALEGQPVGRDSHNACYDAYLRFGVFQARALLDKLRGRAVLDGVRGAAPADRDALAAVIARVGDLALALGDDLESLEINPLRVDGAAVEALDAVVTWARKDKD